MLSGSLLPHNRIEEFWPDARALFGQSRSYWQWRHHFSVMRQTPWGAQHFANCNVADFKALIAPHTLKRRTEDVIGLPAVRDGMITLRAEQLVPEDDPELAPLLAVIAAGGAYCSRARARFGGRCRAVCAA